MNDIENNLRLIKSSSSQIARLDDETRRKILNSLAEELLLQQELILQANALDLASMSQDDPRYDRLQLTPSRIAGLAHDVQKVAQLPSPLNKIILAKTLPNGLQLQKVSVPLGVVAVIYESRPNVTLDVFSLCFKSGNVCVLKGGKEAFYTNVKLVEIIHKVLEPHEIANAAVYLLPPLREATSILLHAVGLVDVCIPRGGKELISYVRDNAKVPVIETGAGVVHTYFDVTGDLTKGKLIIDNAKTRRVSVCNALDTLIINRKRLQDLPELVSLLADKEVEIFADSDSYQALYKKYPDQFLQLAREEDFGKEFLSLRMAIKTVSSIAEAVTHIAHYGSGHSEAIIAEDSGSIEYFLRNVDAAAVYANASTAFTDGGEFGMGAEIGISTQKLHARGPMGLEELTSYKWLIYGTGQIRTVS